MAKAFMDTKQALVNVTTPVHPLPGTPIALTNDAPDYAISVVHEQLVGVWRPLAFFSRQLHPNEQKYNTSNHKLLGLYLAVRPFRFLLEGRPFMAFVDDKPLTFAMSKIAKPWSACQQVVDAVHLGINYARIASDSDLAVQAYRMASTRLQLADVSFDGASLVQHLHRAATPRRS
ncbi:hypothetical protein AAFF_G00399780 [Aldrovandia affinis]|uniref:Reverse transcriptase/retrotransposon-derived protein RNase H-like domain-containing protein n=1 Tax=Aldrovandia affinis TaxID=143900 RepID=A0AAD7SCY4_9TELE|nr:hypothetical protein AAFF_G00399780 [Aldrovandia affinis]